MLSDKNPHERDKNISFQERGHIYNVNGDTKYTSVTTWVKNKFEKFDADKIIDSMMSSSKWEQNKYYPMTKKEIKNLWKQNGCEASKQGTIMHKIFEDYYNGINISQEQKNTIEYSYFEDFIRDHISLIPFRSEWMVYDEDNKISGSIDMTFINGDHTISIYDWKRCKSIEKSNSFNKFSIDPKYEDIPDTNYWHYALQLNMYRHILETKYNKIIKDMYLICIHPELSHSYLKINIPFLEIK